MGNFLQNNRRAVLVWSVLLLILVVAAAFRFQRLDWDDSQYFHPDERAIIFDYGSLGGVQSLNTVPINGLYRADHQPVSFPPGGLSFFIPNDATNLRPTNETETKLYLDAKDKGQSYQLAPNVVPPDQHIPAKAINFWNASFSPLNPRFFAYGSLPMYLIKFSGWVAASVGGAEWNDYQHLMWVGRFLSVVFSLGTILLLFLTGRRAFGPSLGRNAADAIGLLGAAFLAVSVLDIQLAHFLTFDVALTFFISLTIYVAFGHMRSGSRWSAVRLGAAFGLALACKVSALPLVAVVAAACLLFGLYGKAGESGEFAGKPRLKSLPDEEPVYGEVGLGPRLLRRSLLNLIIAGITTLAVWFVAMPYAFIDFSTWLDRVLTENAMARGIADLPYTRQYVNTVPFLYQFGNWIQWGLGIPLGVLAVISLGYGLWQAVNKRLKAEIIIFSWLIPYMLVTFTGEAKFDRYLLPITPLALLLAARLLVVLYLRVKPNPVAPRVDTEIYPYEEGSISPTPIPYPLSPKSRILHPSSFILLVALFIFGWATVWAISFSEIYRNPHSRVSASEWIYQNVPAGARLSYEAWDESLPVSLPKEGKFSSFYTLTGWNSYEDGPNENMANYWADKLRDTDYIVLASNRLYATIPKLPWRYPVTTQMYDLLFKGDLGFSLAATVSQYPTVPLVGWQINDDSADESFSVYDHPKVYIFKKKQQLTDTEWRGLFAPAINAAWVPKRYPAKNDLPVIDSKSSDGVLESTGAAQRVDVGKSLLLDKPVDQQPVIDDNGWNKIAIDQQCLGVVLWFLMAQVIGLIGLPVAMRACRRLPDRGYILAKPFGAALLALVIFLVVGTRFFMYTVATVYMCLILTAVFSGWLWWRYRKDMFEFFARNRRLIILEEGLFLLAFGVFVLIRLGNPDLWHPFFGGEKPMEFAQLNAILKSAYLPPYDPWFSDGYLNYYYYGQYLVTTWIKLTGIHSAIAFNLAIPLLYAFVFTGGFCLSYNAAAMYKGWRLHREGSSPAEIEKSSKVGPMLAGVFGAFCLAVAANVDGLVQLFQHNQTFVDWVNGLKIYPVPADKLMTYDYFRSTRVVPDTINEFPYFSFLYADLHAHLIALPFTLVLLALALNIISVNWADYDDQNHNLIVKQGLRLWYAVDRTLLTPLIFAVIIGLIGATNAWDLPTYSLVIFMALFLAFFRRPDAPVTSEDELEAKTPRFRPLVLLGELVVAGAATGLILGVAYFLLYRNFFSKYQALYSDIKLTNLYSDPGQVIFFWALPLFFTLSFMLLNYGRWLGWKRNKISPDSGDSGSENYEPDFTNQEELDEPVISGKAQETSFIRRPELALSVAGADGGGNLGFGGSGFGGGKRPAPQSRFSLNRFSLPAVIVLAVAAIVTLITFVLPITIKCDYTSALCLEAGPGLTHTGPRWAAFALMAFMVVGFFFLTFGRAFDPNPKQSAEARNPASLFIMLLLLAAFSIIATMEVVYLADDFANSYRERANSIFKFWYQAWTMLAISAAFTGYVLWTTWIAPRWADAPRRAGIVRQFIRLSWVGIATLLIVFVSLYALLVTPTRIAEREEKPLPPLSLDGRAYLDNLHSVSGMPNMPSGKSFDMTYEAKSLHEFYDNISGTPVVLQSSIWPYRGNGSWISINTGLPTVLGWDHHETQQRYDNQVYQRSFNGGGSGNIREIYNTADIENALTLINHYHVTYIHLGTIERDSEVFRHCLPGENGDKTRSPNATCYEPLMSDAGFAKFDKMVSIGLLELAYQNPGVTVLKVTARGRSGVVDPDSASTNPIQSITTDPKLGRLLDQVKRSPTSPQANYDLGVYYYQRREFDKAAESLLKVVQLTPNEVNPYHVLGDIYAASGKQDLALAAWKEPVIRAPQVPAAHNKYAIGLAGAGKYDEAIKEFQATLQLNPKYVEADFHLGEVYEKMGKTPEAVLSYQQAVRDAPSANDFWASRATDRLKLLVR